MDSYAVFEKGSELKLWILEPRKGLFSSVFTFHVDEGKREYPSLIRNQMLPYGWRNV